MRFLASLCPAIQRPFWKLSCLVLVVLPSLLVFNGRAFSQPRYVGQENSQQAIRVWKVGSPHHESRAKMSQLVTCDS